MSIKKYMQSHNLFNTNNATSDAYIDSTGAIISNYAWAVTDFLPVTALQTYTISPITDQSSTVACHAFYDINRELISVVNASANNQTITAPSNTVYIRCSWRSISVTQVMLNEGSTALPYEPYGITWQSIPYKRYENGVWVKYNDKKYENGSWS